MTTYGRITAEHGLRLRSDRSTASISVDLMPFGDRVEVHGVCDGWYDVTWRNPAEMDLRGWAWGQWIKLEAEADPPYHERPVPPLPIWPWLLGIAVIFAIIYGAIKLIP